jgi:multidrug efflux pump subunit AcrB
MAIIDVLDDLLAPLMLEIDIAFLLGVLPLVAASGAGAEMRQSLGAAVFSGMLGVTLFGLLFTPAFYTVVRSRFRFGRARAVKDGLGVPAE